MSSLIWRRAMEMAGILAIGDGLIAAVAPTEHIALWRGGPAAWDRTLEVFARRPGLTRVVGLSEVGVGLWMALHQFRPHSPVTSRARLR